MCYKIQFWRFIIINGHMCNTLFSSQFKISIQFSSNSRILFSISPLFVCCVWLDCLLPTRSFIRFVLLCSIYFSFIRCLPAFICCAVDISLARKRINFFFICCAKKGKHFFIINTMIEHYLFCCLNRIQSRQRERIRLSIGIGCMMLTRIRTCNMYIQ